MLFKIIDKLYKWRVTKANKKIQGAKSEKQEKYRVQTLQNLKNLYEFVRWLNTQGLANRKARKSFWRNVSTGAPLAENTIQDLIKRYSQKPKEK